MSEITVAPEITLQLIERQIVTWQQNWEDCRIAALVADATADAEEKKRLQGIMAKCIKALERLQLLRAELAPK